MNKFLRYVTLYMWLFMGMFSIVMLIYSANTLEWFWFVLWLIPSQIIMLPAVKYWRKNIL
jgi:hypothetical protein